MKHQVLVRLDDLQRHNLSKLAQHYSLNDQSVIRMIIKTALDQIKANNS